jgi:large subunit ribosomal protein L31e
MAEKIAVKQRDYVIPLKKALKSSYSKKANKAVVAVKNFVLKHARNPNVIITNEVNQFIWQNGKFNVPSKVPVTLVEEEGLVRVYLQGSKLIAAEKKAREKEKTELKKAEAKEKKEEKKEDKAKDEEQKKKLEEKRAKEKAAQALEMKRGA